MTRRIYAKPPVNEVILDVRFSEDGLKEGLDELRDVLHPLFGEPTPLQTVGGAMFPTTTIVRGA